MRKISVRALRRILTDDFRHHPDKKDRDAADREGEFRMMYLVPSGSDFKKEWNNQAERLKKGYGSFLTSFDINTPYPGLSKEGINSKCIQGNISLKVKGYRYGAKIDLLRVYIYGFPREFRRLIKVRQIRKLELFEKVRYEIDISEVGKTTEICLTLYEGRYSKYGRAGSSYYTKGTVMKIEVTQNGKWLPIRRGINPPKHIPIEQEYLWVMKYLTEEDNFRCYILDMYKGNMMCCGKRFSSYEGDINFCPMCGCDIKEKFGKIVYSNFRITELSPDLQFSSVVLTLEGAPQNYITTKRTRRSTVPIY